MSAVPYVRDACAYSKNLELGDIFQDDFAW